MKCIYWYNNIILLFRLLIAVVFHAGLLDMAMKLSRSYKESYFHADAVAFEYINSRLAFKELVSWVDHT